MDNIKIKTSMLNSEESSKPDPDSPTESSPTDDEPSVLTDVQARLVISTWKVVKSRVSLEAAGLILFTKLFEVAPNLKKLFYFNDPTISDKEKEEGMKKHGLTVMETVDLATGLLEKKEMEALVDRLIELGIVHNMKSVQLENFAPVGTALIHTLDCALQKEFTEEVQTAWITLYSTIQYYMTKGMKEGLDDY